MEDKKREFYYKNDRLDMLQYIPLGSKAFLEVGCGEGNFALALKERDGAEAWGIEMDEESGGLAKQRLDRVLLGDINILLKELPDKYFDAIIFNDVLEHLYDPYALLENLKAKLKPGGVILSSIPNIRYFRALIELVWHKQWRYTDSGIFDRTHMRFFTKQSIEDMYTNAGYKVLRMEGIHPSKSIRPLLFNMLSFGKLSDCQYLQFATVATPK